MWILWWSVPNFFATRSEYSYSSPCSPPAEAKPMLNVARELWPASASSATTRLESRPPESSTPTGTSETIRRSTARRRASRTCSCHSRGDGDGPSGRVDGGSQYRTSLERPSGSIVRTVAGGSLRTPVRIVRGGGTTECQDM